MFKKLGLAAAAFALSASTSLAATEITWWHAMGGELGKKLEEIATKFNESQSDYKVVPVYKGTYPETLTAAIAAFRANQQPAIVQVFEVGTGTMMAAKGAVYPVYKLMKTRAKASSRSLSSVRSSAIIPIRRATSCRCPLTPPHRSCTTTRMSSRRLALIRKSLRRPGRKSKTSPRKS